MTIFKYITKKFKEDIESKKRAKERYFEFPKALMYDTKYKGLSVRAKMLYSMLLDRSMLSLENDWFDEYGNAYIVCEIDEIEVFLDCARGTAVEALKDLEKFNLVRKIKQGQGKANILYVSYIETPNETLDIHIKYYKRMIDALKHERAVKEEERQKRREAELQYRQEFNNCNPLGNASVEKDTQLNPLESLRSTKNEFAGVQKNDPKDTNRKDTDVSLYVGNAPHGDEEDTQKTFLDRYKDFLIPSRYIKKVLPLMELKIDYNLFDKILVDAVNNPKKKNKENYIVGTLNKLIIKGIFTLDSYMESVSVYNYNKFHKKRDFEETGVCFTEKDLKQQYNIDKMIVEQTITEGLSIDELVEESMKSRDFYISLRPALRKYVKSEMQDKNLFMPRWVTLM